MDWFSWLARTSLDPTLVYEYGLAFARNELQSDDLAHFNHEFLQSMGISVAKHRLQILKLARKDSPNALLLAFRRLNNYLAKLLSINPPPEPYKPKKRIALSGPINGKLQERLAGRNARSLKLSGPLDPKMNDLRLSGPLDGKLFVTNRSPKLSGPLDRRMMMKVSGPLDGRAVSPMSYTHGKGDFEDHLIWAALFDDMKPT